MPSSTIFTVRTKSRSYPMVIGHGAVNGLGKSLRATGLKGTLAVITDTRVGELYLSPILKAVRASGFPAFAVTVSPGESQKSLFAASRLLTELVERKVGRDSAVMAVGGGVIGDLAGFVAAVHHRGIALVHVPTTLLAQVDSSIGGKVGVNHALGKNLIGAFHQPHLVWADTAYLQTLPRRELVCGLGEVLKYGILFGGAFLQWLERNSDRLMDKDPDALTRAVRTCARMKARICAIDERESGKRVVLNLGHTIAHALEVAGGYRSLRHGEAVLLGLRAETELARRLEVLSVRDHARIMGLLDRVPVAVPRSGFHAAEVLDAIEHDKKSVLGDVRFVLPRSLGDVAIISGIERNTIRRSLRVIGV